MSQKSFQISAIVLLTVLAVGLVAYFLVTAEVGESMATKQPPDTDNKFLLGDYYFNHGPDADGTYNLTEARRSYQEALAASPKGDNWAWYQLGRIDFLEGKFDAAIAKFNKQIEYFDDDLFAVYYMLGLTHGYKARNLNREQDWLAAEEYFLKYLEYDPESPWARTDLTWIYFSQGKYVEMIEPLEMGLETHPDNPWLLNMYGLALLNTDRKDEAREVFNKAAVEAKKLTPIEWGKSYPGNDPSAWSTGLQEFRAVIEKNLKLTS